MVSYIFLLCNRTFKTLFEPGGVRRGPGLQNQTEAYDLPTKISKIPLVKAETGESYDEVLLTNLTPDEFSIDGLKELYRFRWEIETAYNVLKNRMKLEKFSDVPERLILQDIYCCVWLYNLTMLNLIEMNEAGEIPQDRYKYEMKSNISIAIGVVKTYFIKSLMSPTQKARKESVKQMNTLLFKHLVPIRPNRTTERTHGVNKSRRSYRYTY